MAPELAADTRSGCGIRVLSPEKPFGDLLQGGAPLCLSC